MDGAMTNFDSWWNEDDLTTQGNNFEYGTPAFWAWEAWGAGARAEREVCATLCDQLSNSSLDLRFGAAIRKRGQA